MKNKFLLAVLIVVATFGWNQVATKKPDWFLKLVAAIPIFNTSVHINFNTQKIWTEQTLQNEFDNLFFVCAREPSNLGDRVCWTYISEFNGIPATNIAFFFDNNKYGYLRVSSDAENHRHIKDYLDETYEYLWNSKGSKDMFGQELGMWNSSTGFINSYLKKPLKSSDTLITWVSRSKTK